MRSILLLALLIGTTGLINAGCSNSNQKKTTTETAAEVDDCPMCPGVQHANADGTCPKCGMKVKG